MKQKWEYKIILIDKMQAKSVNKINSKQPQENIFENNIISHSSSQGMSITKWRLTHI